MTFDNKYKLVTTTTNQGTEYFPHCERFPYRKGHYCDRKQSSGCQMPELGGWELTAKRHRGFFVFTNGCWDGFWLAPSGMNLCPLSKLGVEQQESRLVSMLCLGECCYLWMGVTRSIEGKIHVSTIAQDSLFLHNDASSSKNEIMEEEERDT